MSAYRTYGQHHGTAFFLDGENCDTFLAHMEAWLPEHGVEDYLVGFFEGKLGECKRAFRYLRGNHDKD